MRLDRNELSKAVRMALSMGAVAAVGAVGTAYAQDQNATQTQNNQPQTLQTIVVTGSHIRRVDLETSNPVVTVSRQQIQQTGKLTLGDIVQQLPSVEGPQTNPQVNNAGGFGSSSVALRGLGGNRTLVLVDGERINDADANSIPANMIERVEVLTTGASAVYGSDAVAGVVNFITRKNYQGAEFSADYGISDRGDGVRKGYSFTFGQTGDKGSIIGGVDYNKQEAVFEGNRNDGVVTDPATAKVLGYKGRWHLSPALSLSSTTDGGMGAYAGGSATGLYGNITIPAALRTGALAGCSGNKAARNAGTDGTSLADYHCFGPSDKYNYADVNYAMTPQERTNLFVRGTYHLTDSIDAYLDVYHDKTSSASDLAPLPVTTGGGLVVAANNPFNPFGVEYSTAAGNSMGFRAVPLGLRGAQNGQNIDQINTGLKGTFNLGNQSWSWDLGYDYGHADFQSITLGLVNFAALNPHFGSPNGDGTCGDPALGAACANPFNVNDPATIAALQSSLFSPVSIGYSQERVKHLDLNGGIIDLPAGTMQLAVGAAYRSEYVNDIADPVLIAAPPNFSCTAGSQCTSNLRGGFNVKEAYAELFVPILKDMPFARALNVTLGDRYSKYSTFGSTSNPKLAVEWRPIDDLLLRGTVAKVFRAPGVGDIFAGPSSNADKLSSDPCDYTGATNPNASNPACAGVPLTGGFQNSDVSQNVQTTVVNTGSKFGNFPLGPETGKSFDFGVVYDPHFVPGLSLSADVWRIYINNIITTVGVQNELNQCFGGNTVFCPLIHRFTSGGSAGNIAPNTIDVTGNLGRVDTRGVDFAMSYKLPQFSFGQFNVGLNATYLAQYDNASAPGQPTNLTTYDAGHFLPFGSSGQAACPGPNGGVCLYPRVRAQAFANWQLGSWDASWRIRYISPFTLGAAGPIDPTTGLPSQSVFPAGGSFPGLELHYGATVYNDLSVGYNIQPINTRIDFGVDNVFDKPPPLLYANNTLNANSDPSDFDFIGRYYHARVTVKF